MARFLKDREATLGKAPGELVFVGVKKVDRPGIDLITYSETEINEQVGVPLSDLQKIKGSTAPVKWANITGLHDLNLISEIGKLFSLHPLVKENLVNTGLRPRVEEFEDSVFITLKMLRFDRERKLILSEQVTLILLEGWVLTFQEEPGDVWEPVRERIRRSIGRIRKMGADYLCFALLDIIFDHFIHTVESFGEEIEKMEEEVLENPVPELLDKLNQYKRELNFLRKNIRPARELAAQFAKLETDLIEETTRQFLNGLVATSMQSTETVDTYGNLLTDFLSVYHTAVSNKTNEVMKVLTIFCRHFHSSDLHCRDLWDQFQNSGNRMGI